MSSEATPISPTRFASALQDLSIASLHLKVLELRNSIAHLDYSNEQLRPFAEGKEPVLTTARDVAESDGRELSRTAEPDQDCIDAIRENEAVIARMEERISLVKSEVESRGISWREFRSLEEVEAEAAQARDRANGTSAHEDVGSNAQREAQPNRQEHQAWRDGTFQTGTISGNTILNGQPRPSGGSLTDEELRTRMEEQLRGLDEDNEADGGMHL
jgi:hypothetical protein